MANLLSLIIQVIQAFISQQHHIIYLVNHHKIDRTMYYHLNAAYNNLVWVLQHWPVNHVIHKP